MTRYTHLDAVESAFFTGQLEHIKAQTYDIVYPALRARDFIPVSGDAGPGAMTITYRQFDRVGMAALITAYAKDLPRADITGKPFTSPVESLGIVYGWSLQEIRAAAMAGLPLSQKKSNAAREGTADKEELLAAFGNSDTGLRGFLNHPNVPQASVAGGTWASKVAATPEALLTDLNEHYSSIVTVSKGTEKPNMVILPPTQHVTLGQTRLPDTSITLKDFWLGSHPGVSMDDWQQVVGAGVGDTDRMVMYTKDPNRLTFEIPQEFEQLEVQVEGLDFEVPCHARNGGVIIYRPLSVAYRDGI